MKQNLYNWKIIDRNDFSMTMALEIGKNKILLRDRVKTGKEKKYHYEVLENVKLEPIDSTKIERLDKEFYVYSIIDADKIKNKENQPKRNKQPVLGVKKPRSY